MNSLGITKKYNFPFSKGLLICSRGLGRHSHEKLGNNTKHKSEFRKNYTILKWNRCTNVSYKNSEETKITTA